MEGSGQGGVDGSNSGIGSSNRRRKLEQQQQKESVSHETAMAFVVVMAFLLITYTFHCTWVTSEAYSSPSIVLGAKSQDGGRIIFDDFREAYYWLQMNTPEVSTE